MTDFTNKKNQLIGLYNGYNKTAFKNIKNQYLCHPDFFSDKLLTGASSNDINNIYSFESNPSASILLKTKILTDAEMIVSTSASVTKSNISNIVSMWSKTNYNFASSPYPYDINLIECLDSANALTSSTSSGDAATRSVSTGGQSDNSKTCTPAAAAQAQAAAAVKTGTTTQTGAKPGELFTDIPSVPNMTTYNLLKGLYGWYNILSSTNWKTFLAGNQIKISNIDKDSLPGTNYSYSIFLDYKKIPSTDKKSLDLWNYIDSVIPIDKIIQSVNENEGYFDLYMMRRLLYSHIMLLNYDIAASLYSGAKNDITKTLLTAIIKLVKNTNDGLNNNNVLDDVYTDTNDKLIEYNDNLKLVRDISEKISIQKANYLSNQKKYESTQSMIKTIIIYEIIIAIVLLLITIISTFIIYLNTEIPEQIIKGLGHIQMIISLLAIGLIIFKYNSAFRVKENFIEFNTLQFNLITGQNQNSGTKTEIIDNLSSYASVMIDQILLFGTISNIINNTLKVDKAYGDMGTMVSNEFTYYKKELEQLIQQNEKLISAVNLIKISSFSHKYRLYLMIFLSLLLAITVELWIMTDSQNILIISSVIGLIGFIIYIQKLSANVRTDADKYYWSATIKNLG
jgi:hypothetical protein